MDMQIINGTAQKQLIVNPLTTQHMASARAVPHTLTNEQFDALDSLRKNDLFHNEEMRLRQFSDKSLFVTFTVPCEILPITAHHRYLIAPDGDIEQLTPKYIEGVRHV